MGNVMQKIWSLALAAVLVASCGGGGGGGFAGIDRLGVTTGTITGFGSIIVNGVEYETSGTSFLIDDTSGTIGNLQVGQVVTLRWSSTDDGVTRRADEVVYDDAVEGPITAASIDTVAGTFVVLGQTVAVDPDTSFASPLFDIGSLADGDFVEVSGFLDATGVVRATRVERKPAGGEIEIRGLVTGLTATTFAIGTQVVNIATATIDAPGGVLANGDFVEAKGTFVNGSGQLVATRVELEDEDDSVGESGEDAEVEGYVTSFTSANAFSVAGIPVQSSVAATGGTVALGAKVRVKGEFNAGGAIIASEVRVRTGSSGSSSTVRIAANVDAVTPGSNQLVVLGVTVTVNADTRLEDQSDEDVRDFSLTDLRSGANGDFVEIRGVPQGGNTLLATLLQRQEPDDEGNLRGPVATFDEPDFTILGVVVQTTEFTFFENDLDFFGGDVVVGDIIKVKFPLEPFPATTPIEAEEVELED